MILAELEVFHSRPVAPTRRVALGSLKLPASPPPGPGGLLLGGVVGTFVSDIDPDLVDDLTRLTFQIEHGYRVSQPRLRHRLQTDRVGLTRSVHRLIRHSSQPAFEFESAQGAPAQHVLAAVYAAGRLDVSVRGNVMAVIRRGIRWTGGSDDRRLIAYLSGDDVAGALSAGAADPVSWAYEVLGFDINSDGPPRPEVLRRFRALLRDAHPDNGGHVDDAAERIAELTEARRILLT